MQLMGCSSLVHSPVPGDSHSHQQHEQQCLRCNARHPESIPAARNSHSRLSQPWGRAASSIYEPLKSHIWSCQGRFV